MNDLRKHLKTEKGTRLEGWRFSDRQSQCLASQKILLSDGAELQKSGRESFINYSYGNDGPDQQTWEETVVNEYGVIQKMNFDDYGKRSQKYLCALKTGDYVSFYVQDNKIVGLVMNDRDGVFYETDVKKLPLKGSTITKQYLEAIVESMKDRALFPQDKKPSKSQNQEGM